MIPNPWNPDTHPQEYDYWHSIYPPSLADDPAAVERGCVVASRHYGAATPIVIQEIIRAAERGDTE